MIVANATASIALGSHVSYQPGAVTSALGSSILRSKPHSKAASAEGAVLLLGYALNSPFGSGSDPKVAGNFCLIRIHRRGRRT